MHKPHSSLDYTRTHTHTHMLMEFSQFSLYSKGYYHHLLSYEHHYLDVQNIPRLASWGPFSLALCSFVLFPPFF